MAIETMLRDRLAIATGQRKWKENPLITIGLGETILRLPVDDEKLSSAIRKYVRELVMIVHPDADYNASSAEKKVFAEGVREAFTLLKDDEILDEALEEFRRLQSYESTEVSFLREQLKMKGQLLDSRTARLTSLEAAQSELERRAEGILLAERNVRMITGNIDQERKEFRETIRLQNTEIRRLSDITRRFVGFLSMQRRKFLPGEGRPLPVHPTEATRVSFLVFRTVSKYSDDVRKALKKKTRVPADLLEQYRLVKDALRLHVERESRDQLRVLCSFHTAEVHGGCIGETPRSPGERIVGSVPLRTFTRLSRTRIDAFRGESIASSHIEPFLRRGNVLVTVRCAESSAAEYVDARDSASSTKQLESQHFVSRRVILAVE